ncbi:MAG: response regulator transcription factor [Anaerolineae bacterium]|nr:response regulator transcription factor [Anaerolineae bacterium]
MKPKVLLIDDDATLLEFLKEYLQTENLAVLTASNGPEGLRLAYREHPNLVILDVMMPGMDGWEVTARLRELSDVPIILLTGKSSEADKLRGFGLGVDDYVVKPFSFAELFARINAVLARIRPASNPRNLCAIGELILDFDRRELRRGENSISLTPTEYRLLEVLAQNAGKAVAESTLVKAIWGANRHEETVAVRRYIWLLRQKLEEDPANPQYLLTVRGYGYRLESGKKSESLQLD